MDRHGFFAKFREAPDSRTQTRQTCVFGVNVQVLIVEPDRQAGETWAAHIRGHGLDVTLVETEQQALDALSKSSARVILLDLVLAEGSAFAVADVAGYRYPDSKIVFVTDTDYFSDGSIFRHLPNAQVYLPRATPPEDIANLVHHYCTRLS